VPPSPLSPDAATPLLFSFSLPPADGEAEGGGRRRAAGDLELGAPLSSLSELGRGSSGSSPAARTRDAAAASSGDAGGSCTPRR